MKGAGITRDVFYVRLYRSAGKGQGLEFHVADAVCPVGSSALFGTV